MPEYINNDDIAGKPKNELANTGKNINQVSDVVSNINGLLNNANKFMDNLQLILNRKVTQEGNNQLTNDRIDAKAQKIAELKYNVNQNFSNDEMVLNPPVKKKYIIKIDRDKASDDLMIMLNNLDKTKRLKDYIDIEIKELYDNGIIHSAVEQFINKHTEIIEE